MGWVQKRRNLGAMIFIDLRDRSGLLQLVFDENDCGKENFDKAYTLRSEYVIAATGVVEKRSGAVNENLKTGDIEIRGHRCGFFRNRRPRPSRLKMESPRGRICA